MTPTSSILRAARSCARPREFNLNQAHDGDAVALCLLQGMGVVGRTRLQSARPETDMVDVALKLLA
ncbi:MAG: hypothetical protein JO107_00910 [Hyphomicrobiales bacterium]|nr:hypothetical protein [Hyphomicrobiales bacterium]MBV8661636.1 hypothetical protein [Hyphomicrobiales bacterium]